MEMVLALVALVFSIISLVCNIMILIHAFKQSVGEGFLCLCVPCYILYYMFAKFEHTHKGIIIAGALIGNAVSTAVQLSLSGSRTSSYGGGGYGGY